MFPTRLRRPIAHGPAAFLLALALLIPAGAQAAAAGGAASNGLLPDNRPDSFAFAAVGNATPGASVSSDPVTVSGINIRSQITVTGGRYRINNGSFTSAAGYVRVNDRVVAEVLTSDQNLATTTATLTIGGVAGSFAVTTRPAQTGQPAPAEVLNLSHWKLTLPVNSRGGLTGSATEISPSQLIGPPAYSSAYLYTDASGAVMFHAPTNGATTTPGQGSDNTRTELRELYRVPGPTEWTNAIGGTLTASCRVDRTPAIKKKVYIGQIHGLSSIMMLMYYDEIRHVVEARLYDSPGGSAGSPILLASDVALGARIDYRIQWIGSTVSLTVNGRTVNQSTASSWNRVPVYFKAGAYSSTGNTGNPDGDASDVRFSSLELQH